jgi:hypothetical protein
MAIGAACALGLAPSAHAAVPVTQVGWWTRSPVPPTVPEGGAAVGAAPDGALTVSAVEFDAGDGASGASLRLVETGGQGQQAAGVQVCPTDTSWSAAAGDPLDKAPKDACASASVAMTRGADGTWTADVQKLVEGKTGDVALMILPAAGSVAFQIEYAPPTVDGSVSTESTGSSGESSFTSETIPETAPSSAFEAPPPVTPTSEVASPPVATAPTTAVTIASTPDFAAGIPARSASTERGVTKATVLIWYVVAAAFGAFVAGISWMRTKGYLSPVEVLATVRRRR